MISPQTAMISPQTAYNIYQKNKDATTELLASYNNEPLEVNAVITNTYIALSRNDPAFLWLAAGAIGSNKVGENIQNSGLGNLLNGLPALGDFVSEHASFSTQYFADIYAELPGGNQAIFKNLIPVYLTFLETGSEGLLALQKHEAGKKLISDDLYNAFVNHEIIVGNLNTIADSLGVSPNDIKAIRQLFSDPQMQALALDVAISFMKHEQGIVQIMYSDELIEAMTNSFLVQAGELFGFTGVKVNDHFYSFAEYVADPGDYNQRVHYFTVVLTAIADVYSNSKALDSYLFSAHFVAENNSIARINPYSMGTPSNAVEYMEAINLINSFKMDFLKPIDLFVEEHSKPFASLPEELQAALSQDHNDATEISLVSPEESAVLENSSDILAEPELSVLSTDKCGELISGQADWFMVSQEALIPIASEDVVDRDHILIFSASHEKSNHTNGIVNNFEQKEEIQSNDVIQKDDESLNFGREQFDYNEASEIAMNQAEPFYLMNNALSIPEIEALNNICLLLLD